MELNYECLRKTLMFLEKNLKLSDDLDFKPLGIHEIVDYSELKKDFDQKDIAYCVHMLADSGMISVLSDNSWVRELRVQTITYKGHEFLQQIKNDTVWKRVTDKLKPIGVFTINFISQVAVNVITEIITKNCI